MLGRKATAPNNSEGCAAKEVASYIPPLGGFFFNLRPGLVY